MLVMTNTCEDFGELKDLKQSKAQGNSGSIDRKAGSDGNDGINVPTRSPMELIVHYAETGIGCVGNSSPNQEERH